jgi:uncharacterized NAD-dependent epimerase/dehydratase family protein
MTRLCTAALLYYCRAQLCLLGAQPVLSACRNTARKQTNENVLAILELISTFVAAIQLNTAYIDSQYVHMLLAIALLCFVVSAAGDVMLPTTVYVTNLICHSVLRNIVSKSKTW